MLYLYSKRNKPNRGYHEDINSSPLFESAGLIDFDFNFLVESETNKKDIEEKKEIQISKISDVVYDELLKENQSMQIFILSLNEPLQVIARDYKISRTTLHNQKKKAINLIKSKI